MSTSLFLVTVKLLLTLVLLVAQVSAPPPVQVPSQIRPILDESVCDKVIADFREEVERHNAVAFIRRENGQDVVDIDRERYTKRILVVVSAFKVGRQKLRLQMVDEYVRKFHDLFVEFGLILPLDIESSWHDIVKLYNKIFVGIYTETVLLQHIKIFLNNHQFREAIHSFYDAKVPDKFVRKNELANYIMPFAREIFWTYDGAFNYITRQYQEHCLSPDGIVQQNKLHYLKLWWSSVSRFKQCLIQFVHFKAEML